MKETSSEAKQRPWAKFLWAGIMLHSLTYCSGSTDGGGGGGTAGFSFAGHTSGCAQNCSRGGCLGSPGCPPIPQGGSSGSGGTPSSGSGGMLAGNSNGGTPAAGFGGFGFAGHTADCLNNCHLGCAQQCGGVNSGGTPAAGATGLGGALDGLGGAAEGGQAAGGEPAAMRRVPARESRACYDLTGYQADPCLPADDSLLEWLSSPNLGCPLTVVNGPELMSGPIGRACCYSVSCAQPSE